MSHIPYYIQPNDVQRQEIFNRFRGIMERYPFLTDYIQQDFSEHFIIRLEKPIGTSGETLPINFCGGDYLFQGMVELRKYIRNPGAIEYLNLAKKYFNLALKNKVTRINRFIFLMLKPLLLADQSYSYYVDLLMFYADLALRNQDQGDETELLFLFNIYPIVHLLNLNQEIIIRLSYNGLSKIIMTMPKETLVTIKNFYTNIIEGYENNLPTHLTHLLACAAFIKVFEKEWIQAKELYERAIHAYGDNVSPRLLADAARVYLELKEWTKAKELYMRAIYASKGNVPPGVLVNAAYAHKKLKEWTKAKELYRRAIHACRDNMPPNILNAAYAYKELKEWTKAKELYTYIIHVCRGRVPFRVVAGAAKVHLELKEWTKAKKLYMCIIYACQDHVPPKILANAAKAHLELEEWIPAKELYKRAIQAYKAHRGYVPSKVLICATKVDLEFRELTREVRRLS